MIRNIIKNTPLLYRTALKFKHRLWSADTVKAVKTYLSENPVAKLQLGAGANILRGWFNTDYFARPNVWFLDVTKKFPFADGTVQFIYSEHHIEHITYLQAQYMLAETFRSLAPGGYIKIDTPDLDKYLQAYLDKAIDQQFIRTHINDWIYSGFDKAASYVPVNNYADAHFVNDIFLNYEHRFIYNDKALIQLLEKAGFINVIVCSNGNSCHEAFNGVEAHTSAFNKHFTLSVQAQKPA